MELYKLIVIFTGHVCVLYVFIEVDVVTGFGEIKLVPGSSPFEGAVKVRLNKQWRTMCDKWINPDTATVICRQLGLPSNNVTLKNSKYTNDWGSWLRCTGTEWNVFSECNWTTWPKKTCPGDESQGIACNGNVKLFVDDTSWPHAGDIVVYEEGRYISVSDSNPDPDIATVVCRQMGCPIINAQLTLNSYFGFGSSYPSNISFSCHGNETSIWDCERKSLGENTTQAGGLGVVCNNTFGEIQLLPSNVTGFHVVNVFDSIEWSVFVTFSDDNVTVTVDEGTRRAASIICYQNGFSRFNPVLKISPVTDERSTIELSKYLICTGNESNLFECPYYEAISPTAKRSPQWVLLSCNASVHLATEGNDDGLGLLQLVDDATDVLKTVTSSYVDKALASVVCRDLGYDIADPRVVLKDAFESENETSITVDIVCSGLESSLRDCYRSPVSSSESIAMYNIYIDCKSSPVLDGTFQLETTIGSGFAFGQLMWVPKNVTKADRRVCRSAVIDVSQTASVICHEQGFSRFVDVYFHKNSTLENDTNVEFEDIGMYACHGTEDKVADCPYYIPKLPANTCYDMVHIICSELHSIQPAVTKTTGISETLECRNFYCLNGACEDVTFRTNEICEIVKGAGCTVETSTEQMELGNDKITTVGTCRSTCVPMNQQSVSLSHTTSCCYTSKCNTNNRVPSPHHVVRLVDGMAPYEGYVQAYDWSVDKWRYIGKSWMLRGSVALFQRLCEQAGFLSSVAAKYPEEETTRNESNFTDCWCSRDFFRSCNLTGTVIDCLKQACGPCHRSEALRINCNAYQPPMRLVGSKSNMGRVEVLYNNTWGTICPAGYADFETVSTYVCQALGYSMGYPLNNYPGNFTQRIKPVTSPVHFSIAWCYGHEKSLLQCELIVSNEVCDSSNEIAVLCENGTAGEQDWQYNQFTESSRLDKSTTDTPMAISDQTIMCFAGMCERTDCMVYEIGIRLQSCSKQCSIKLIDQTSSPRAVFSCDDCAPDRSNINVSEFCCSDAYCSNRTDNVWNDVLKQLQGSRFDVSVDFSEQIENASQKVVLDLLNTLYLILVVWHFQM